MKETKCPFCGEKVYLGIDRCPYCAEKLPDNLEPINEEGTASTGSQGPQQGNKAQKSGYTWNRQDSFNPGSQQTYGPGPGYSQNQQQYNQGPQQPYGYQPGYQYMPPIQRMSFGQAVRTCVIEKYATFSGRARRSEFWWFFLAQALLSYIMSTAVTMSSFKSLANIARSGGELFGIAWDSMASVLKNPVWWLSIVVWLALLLPNIAAICRRLHDTGKSGWWQLLFYGSILLSYVMAFIRLRVLLLHTILSIVTLAAVIVMIVWLCKDSDPDPNKWGPSPKYGLGNPPHGQEDPQNRQQ
ncbi:MAG: DUF805 domain-containing protein [Bacteroidales bacterium]|nr:DUF805 domain-containing protein [Bacteroidales bacterium]